MTPAPAIKVGANLAWVQTQLGGEVLEQDSSPLVSSTTVQILANNPDRMGLVMMNLGTGDMFVSFNPNVSTQLGIKLAANGGFISMKLRDDFTMITRAYYAISPSVNGNIYIVEYILIVKTGPGLATA